MLCIHGTSFPDIQSKIKVKFKRISISRIEQFHFGSLLETFLLYASSRKVDPILRGGFFLQVSIFMLLYSPGDINHSGNCRECSLE